MVSKSLGEIMGFSHLILIEPFETPVESTSTFKMIGMSLLSFAHTIALANVSEPSL